MAIEFVWIHPRLWVIKRYIVYQEGDNFASIRLLGILGFPTHQNFDCTTYDEICKAFLRRSKKVMIKRELALLAQNSEDPKLQKENIHGLCLQF